MHTAEGVRLSHIPRRTVKPIALAFGPSHDGDTPSVMRRALSLFARGLDSLASQIGLQKLLKNSPLAMTRKIIEKSFTRCDRPNSCPFVQVVRVHLYKSRRLCQLTKSNAHASVSRVIFTVQYAQL